MRKKTAVECYLPCRTCAQRLSVIQTDVNSIAHLKQIERKEKNKSLKFTSHRRFTTTRMAIVGFDLLSFGLVADGIVRMCIRLNAIRLRIRQFSVIYGWGPWCQLMMRCGLLERGVGRNWAIAYNIPAGWHIPATDRCADCADSNGTWSASPLASAKENQFQSNFIPTEIGCCCLFFFGFGARINRNSTDQHSIEAIPSISNGNYRKAHTKRKPIGINKHLTQLMVVRVMEAMLWVNWRQFRVIWKRPEVDHIECWSIILNYGNDCKMDFQFKLKTFQFQFIQKKK